MRGWILFGSILPLLACGGGGNPTAPTPAPSPAPVEIVLPTIDEALTWLGPGPGQPLITTPGRMCIIPDLQIDPDGNLFLAWTSDDPAPGLQNQHSHVVWIDVDWQQVQGGGSTPASVTWAPPLPDDIGHSGPIAESVQLTVREFGGPVIAYVRRDPEADPYYPAPATAHVWEWTGERWETLGMAPGSSTLEPRAWISSASRPHIMLTACRDNSLLAAWRSINELGGQGVAVARCIEGEWSVLRPPTEALQELGVRISEPGFSMVADDLGLPIVALADDTYNSGPLHVLRHEESGWTLLGAIAEPANHGAEGDSRSPVIEIHTLPGGQVDLAWHTVAASAGVLHESFVSNVYMRRWSGEDWRALGSSDQGRGLSDILPRTYEYYESLEGRNPSLVSQSAAAFPIGLFRDAAGYPMVFWVESSGVRTAEARGGTFARRWSGSSWEPTWIGSDAVPGMTPREEPGVTRPRWQVWRGSIDVDDQGRFAMVQWNNTEEGARIAVRVGRIPFWEGLPTTAEAASE